MTKTTLILLALSCLLAFSASAGMVCTPTVDGGMVCTDTTVNWPKPGEGSQCGFNC